MNQQLINKYDSEFCGSLPIHLINVIQPYGALIALEKRSRKILQISENVQKLLGKEFSELSEQVVDRFLSGLSFDANKENLPQQCTIGGTQYLAIVHEGAYYDIVEINLHSQQEALESSFIDVYKGLKQAIAKIESAGDLETAMHVAAKELKAASSFDKVMIYRFDENWNGHVLAEEMEGGMESYMNFTFPASDIPKQARELYLKNAYRFIPDRAYEPVKLMPVINPATQTFIDMSACNMRGVTTVHIEYLKNMHVNASMSTRILKDGKLWGLIACHNRTPMQVNYKMCAIFELLSGIVSTKISALENNEKYISEAASNDLYSAIVEAVYRSGEFANSLLSGESNILRLFNASGAAVISKGNITQKGVVPTKEEIEDVLLWLQTREIVDIYKTDSLSSEFEYAADLKETASGLLAIPIDGEGDEFILLFRPEVLKVINWGGDPETRINFEADMRTYHPRFSFKLWQEKVNGNALPWTSEEISLAANLRDLIRDFSDRQNTRR